jgi:beta-1,4-mannosyl-glycoprotein beta-1,4-N-acetylglucosaminyltransferase
MIIDCFMFYNEYDVLEGRLEYLYNHVDYFVIVESNITHAGNPKPLNFMNNMSRYKKYLDKVIYNPVYIDPSKFNFAEKISDLNMGHAAWQVENFQRNHITESLKFFDDSAIVMVGDCDEIPNRELMSQLHAIVHNAPSHLCVLDQKMFFYNFKTLQSHSWFGTAVTFNGIVKQVGAQWMRAYRSGLSPVYNGGWHISYWGNENFVQNKIKNFSHQEYNRDEFTDLNRIKSAIERGVDPYGRSDATIVFDTSTLPSDFYEIFDKISYKPN